MNACYKTLRVGYCLLVFTKQNILSRCTIAKEYFSLSHFPTFFLAVQNVGILPCLNGLNSLSNAVIKKGHQIPITLHSQCTFSVHQCTKVHFSSIFGALVHRSALFLVHQCTESVPIFQQYFSALFIDSAPFWCTSQCTSEQIISALNLVHSAVNLVHCALPVLWCTKLVHLDYVTLLGSNTVHIAINFP